MRDKYINDDEVPLSEFTYTLGVEPKGRKDKTIKLPLVTPLLWIELETRTGENWKALLDTGAAVNLASPAFLERVGARYMGTRTTYSRWSLRPEFIPSGSAF